METTAAEQVFNVFNIERYGIEDGPGIRTVVFLKGCLLRCRWCANPESQEFFPQILVKNSICVSCGKCMAICPSKAVHLLPGFGYITDAGKCKLCGQCIENCYVNARCIMGKTYTQRELLKEIASDEKYFLSSGGGITYSGGEPLFYSKPIRNMVQETKRRGYTTLIETCGEVPLDNIREVADVVDYIYFDFKEINPQKHKELTGRDNRRILANLDWLCKNFHGQLSVRYPYIPFCNSADEDILGFLRYVRNLHTVSEIVFLPYHRLGLPKYLGLGRTYLMGDMKSLKISEMEHVKELADSLNMKIRIQ
jgi:pyruvate formate lyase activating enzyme